MVNVTQSPPPPPMLLNTVVCFPASPLLKKKKNEPSLTATLRERKKRRKYSAFSCLQSIFYHPHPVKLTFPSELLLPDCPSLPHLLPVCQGLVILSHFQLPSLLFFLPLATAAAFCCRCTFKPTFICIYISSFFHLRKTFLLCVCVWGGERQVFCQPANGMKRAHQHVFFFTGWTLMEDN